MGGDLVKFLSDHRSEGSSYGTIASLLQDVDVIVTSQTVMLWCKRLGIES